MVSQGSNQDEKYSVSQMDCEGEEPVEDQGIRGASGNQKTVV